MRLWPGSPAPAVPDLAHHAVALVQVSSLLVQGLGYQVHNEEGDLLTVNTVQDLCVLVPVPGQLCLRPRPRMETQPVSLVSRVEGDHQSCQADVGAHAQLVQQVGGQVEVGAPRVSYGLLSVKATQEVCQ